MRESLRRGLAPFVAGLCCTFSCVFFVAMYVTALGFDDVEWTLSFGVGWLAAALVAALAMVRWVRTPPL